MNPSAKELPKCALLIVTACSAIVACDDASTVSEPTPSLPSVTTVAVEDSAGPIFRTLSVNLDGVAAIRVDYWTDGASRLRVVSGAGSEHRVYVPRLRAASLYSFEVTPIGPFGDTGDTFEGQFQTDSLPPELAALQFPVIGHATFPLLMMEGLAIIVDTDGQIVWYWNDSITSFAVFTRLANGNLVFDTRDGVSVVTPSNQIVATLSEADAALRAGVGTFRIHHDVITSSDDNLLFLVADTGSINDTVWFGEAIWEWDPVTDELLKRWSSFDFLSPTVDRGDRTVPADWLHANSLSIGPRGNVVVSFFWLHEVLSIASDFQSIEWRLGGPASTFAVADGAMDAGQHTAAEVSTNRILLFDNGRDRPGGELFSRALEIELDQVNGSARIAWEFRPQPDIYAPVVSSARRLENGNTVVGFGLTEGLFDPPSTGPISVYEVTPTNRVLWFLRVDGIGLVYRFTPLDQVDREVEVMERPTP